MSPPSFMAYLLIGGAAVVSLISMAFIGTEAWIAPAFVIPLLLLYGLYDRQLRQRERRNRGTGTEASDLRRA